MNRDFNVYKWRRDQLTENEAKSIGTYYDRPGKFKGKEYDGYVRLRPKTSDDEITADFTKKGYVEIGWDEIDDDDRGTLVHVYYKKK
jgi:hypothetical protein